ARGKKILDGKLADIKRREAAEGVISVGFADDASRAAAGSVLGDRTLVAESRAPRARGTSDGADWEVKLADGATSQQLLAALVNGGIAVRRFEVVIPTLHQIFVDRVGASAAVAERRPEAT